LFRAVVMDVAGNSAATPAISMVFDNVVTPLGTLGPVFSSSGDSRQFSVAVTGGESDSTYNYFVDPPGTVGEITLGSAGAFGLSLSIGSDFGSGTQFDSGIYVFRAVAFDVAGNSAGLGTMAFNWTHDVDVSTGEPPQPNYFPLQADQSVATSQGGRPIRDAGFDLLDAGYDVTWAEPDPAEAKALALGAALSRYLNPSSDVDLTSSSIVTSEEATKSASSSIPALANALSEYRALTSSLKPKEELVDPIRRMTEQREYVQTPLVPPNGSS